MTENPFQPPSMARRFGRAPRLVAILATCAIATAACSSSKSSTASSSSSSAGSSASSSSSSSSSVDSAAAALLPAAIKSAGKLNDGVNLPNPPLEYQVNGTGPITGFDADLARALAAKLGLTVNFENLAFTALQTSLDSGRVDIILSGLFDNATRQAKYSIIDYLNTGAQIFTTVANQSKAPTLDSLCGQTVETAVGTAFTQELKDLSTQICAGKQPITVLEVGGSFAEEVLQITTGRAIAAIATPDNLAYSLSTTPNTYALVGKPFDLIPYGIDVPKANTALLDALKAAFADILADGTYKAIAAKYNLSNSAVSAVTVDGGK